MQVSSSTCNPCTLYILHPYFHKAASYTVHEFAGSIAMVRNNFSCTGEESKLVDCIGVSSESDNRTCERNNSAGVTCVIPIGELRQTFNVK